MEQNKKQHVDHDYARQRVPASARKSFLSMFVVMLGFTFFSASMSVGARMGNGLSFTDFVWQLLSVAQYLVPTQVF